jgi:tRNA pseudouridine38-40 synthase
LKIPIDKLSQVLNGFLPPDISVTAAEEVPDDFVPRFNAKQKTYRYQIYNAPYPNPLLRRYSAFVPQPLDREAMRKAAPYFIGRHDFKAFRATAPGQEEDKSTVREIFDCVLRTANNFSGAAEDNGCLKNVLTLYITGGGFLYNMVRIIAGTVLYAGMGKIRPDEIPDIIMSKERKRAGKTMPPEGLTLMEIEF